jgi:hypothetical protein
VPILLGDRGWVRWPGDYAKGARRGAPEAVQVADRFHLLQNLAEMLEVVFTTHSQDLRAVEQARRAALGATGSLPLPPAESQKKVRLLAGARHERRKALCGARPERAGNRSRGGNGHRLDRRVAAAR